MVVVTALSRVRFYLLKLAFSVELRSASLK